ncbi:MoaD/ThiS family protein [Synechococcus sp. Nb3U1]|uniref:MoaD/ThiS family protein n=1 Tax=Synechococcus sp. Nb3U1 TaxID=1914529 RepID=UPI001F42DD00|nr:MoaD/ThiS family protein [Synechococcus sp. Nb3U1]MCF2969631.1 MoaD/ThiS family protein [Synechococcus sp. Nb3U1]
MATKILIPSPLRPYTDNQEAVEIDGSSVGEVMGNLIARYSDLKRHLYTEDGKLRNFVNVYLNDEDVRDLAQGDSTPVGEKATISIVPAIAGGF